MDEKTKVIVNYLPQYHIIPENDRWWGKGFTDWMPVQNAKPLYREHLQPKIPENQNYYCLNNIHTINWQAELAREYGVYGFAIYHYWFNSNMKLLEKPAELILEHKDIDINYLFLWDNATWKRTWSNVKHANDWAPNFDDESADKEAREETNGILAELIYGEEKDWEIHFNYLLPFFKDFRYIKIDNKPVFGFFQPGNGYGIIKKMVNYWNNLAKKNGFAGIICMSRDNYMHQNLDYRFRYTPLVPNNKRSYIRYKMKDLYAKKMKKVRIYDYDKCWKEILKEARNTTKNTFLSGFVQFDDTPRRGIHGRIIEGASPKKFGKYMKGLLDISSQGKKEFVFLTAWNEWGEGAYLEPDSIDGLAYLQELKRAIEG